MDIKKVKKIIDENKIEHENAEDWEAEIVELEVYSAISDYCIERAYQANDFPQKLFDHNISISDYVDAEGIFTYDLLLEYIEIVALTKDDVADLLFYHSNAFWPNFKLGKEDMLQLIRDVEGDDHYTIIDIEHVLSEL